MVVELVSVSTCVDPFCLMYIAKSLKCGSGSSSADFYVVPRAVQAVCPAHPIVTVTVQLLSCVWIFVTRRTTHSALDFPALHYLQEFVQTHVHWIIDAIQPSQLWLDTRLISLGLSFLFHFPLSNVLHFWQGAKPRLNNLRKLAVIFAISTGGDITKALCKHHLHPHNTPGS